MANSIVNSIRDYEDASLGALCVFSDEVLVYILKFLDPKFIVKVSVSAT